MLTRFATRWIVASSTLAAWWAANADEADGTEGIDERVGIGCLRIPAVTSFGRSTRTGPGRPEVAISKASLIRRGNSVIFLTITFHFVQARLMPTTSASWKASVPMLAV